MALQQINDFDPNYQEAFGGDDIKGRSVYTEETDEKIGTVDDALVDEDGQFRYLVVALGAWVLGKKVLLPIGRSRIDSQKQRVYALGMSKEQAEKLPKFNENQIVDYDYEEQVRGVYRPAVSTPGPVANQTSTPTSAPDSYNYQQEPGLYGLRDQDHQNLKLYEERLVAGKRRQKTGEVAIGKHTETETQRVSVPVERERVVIERSTPTGPGTAVAAGEANFREGEVAHMDIYEETADVRKEAFVREEIKVHKEVDQETVALEETIRREELDIDSEGRTVEDKTRRTGFNDRI